MTHNTRTMQASPEAVWAVLTDGWLSPLRVVCAARIRDAPPWLTTGSDAS
jgi:hypothetical protein